uniref:FLYWCH-type domain-containing protein n=1 Tax=Syphacia muris TaxID=451379 RepID=A0A0N5AZ00_9BILA
MLAVSESIQQDNSTALNLISAYQSDNKKLDEMPNSANSQFDSKETSPESLPKSENSAPQESEIIEADASSSDCDAEKATQTCASESTVEDGKLVTSPKNDKEEAMECEEAPDTAANSADQSSSAQQTDLLDLRNSNSSSSSTQATSSHFQQSPCPATATKQSNPRKRPATKYPSSSQKNAEEERWYKCISAPKDLITEIVAGLRIIPALTTNDYFIFECEEKKTYNCPYRVRIRSDATFVYCEHNGCHEHDTDSLETSRFLFLHDTDTESLETTSQPKKWFTCFDGPLTLKTPLTASLCVATRNKCQDGYELYDCLYQKKFKCDYKVRVKQIGDYFICDELGSHQHGVEKELGSTTGLPSAFKDVVDVAFYQNWSYSIRQQKLAEAAIKLGLIWDRKLTRQIDNRLSYLRRTTNIRRAVELGKHKDTQDGEKE